MLVIDFHTLRPVNFLNLVYDIALQLVGSADFKEFLRNDGSNRELLSLAHIVAFTNDKVL